MLTSWNLEGCKVVRFVNASLDVKSLSTLSADITRGKHENLAQKISSANGPVPHAHKRIAAPHFYPTSSHENVFDGIVSEIRLGGMLHGLLAYYICRICI